MRSIRRIRRRVICFVFAVYLTPAQESLQFGMRYLLGWTTGVCLLLVVVRYSLPNTTFSRNIVSELPEILFAWLLLAVLSALLCLPCVRLALGDKLSVRSLTWLVSVFILGPPSLLAAFGLLEGTFPPMGEALWSFYLFAFGLAFTTLLVLYGMRLLGFRLVSDERVWKAPW